MYKEWKFTWIMAWRVESLDYGGHCICATWQRATHDQASCTSSISAVIRPLMLSWGIPPPWCHHILITPPKPHLQTPSANESEDWVSDAWALGETHSNHRHDRKHKTLPPATSSLTLAVMANLQCLQDCICNALSSEDLGASEIF